MFTLGHPAKLLLAFHAHSVVCHLLISHTHKLARLRLGANYVLAGVSRSRPLRAPKPRKHGQGVILSQGRSYMVVGNDEIPHLIQAIKQVSGVQQ